MSAMQMGDIGQKIHSLLQRRGLVLKIAGILSAALVFVHYLGPFRLCGTRGGDLCPSLIVQGELVLLPVVPFFIFVAITYFLREGFFEESVKAASIWLAGTMALLLIMPDYYEVTTLLIMLTVFVAIACWGIVVEFFGPAEQEI